MAVQEQVSAVRFPSLALAENAATGEADGTIVHSSTTAGMMEAVAGQWKKLRTAAGSATITQVEVDFGSAAVTEAGFSVTVTGATTGQRVVAVLATDAPTGRSADEVEIDPISVRGRVTATNTVRLYCSADTGAVTGKYKINVMVG